MPESHAFLETARSLYRGPASTFVERRDMAVRNARDNGDAQLAAALKALRRPTASAAILNTLPQPDIEEISSLAERLREATRTLHTDELRALNGERSALIERLTRNLDVSASLREEVRGTLLAALADPTAQAALCSGMLVRPLSYSGFGEVVIDGATAVPAPTLRLVRDQREIDDARRAVASAQRRLEAAQEAANAALAALQTAESTLATAQQRLTRLEG